MPVRRKIRGLFELPINTNLVVYVLTAMEFSMARMYPFAAFSHHQVEDFLRNSGR